MLDFVQEGEYNKGLLKLCLNRPFYLSRDNILKNHEKVSSIKLLKNTEAKGYRTRLSIPSENGANSMK